MVRLYHKDFMRLKPGQFCYWIDEVHGKMPMKFVHRVRARWATYGHIFVFYNYMAKSKVFLEVTYLKRPDNKNYLTKVTKKNEPEFLAHLLSL